ncbi:hypothetical protein FEF65_07145 [Mariprofundus erugo]|uniref:Flagellar motor protein MotB n=1 Tax=Mariprofundus erugo TaxID=2528639 RepID=A0A5R9GL43_9PROT|nr:hypothetical protein [Mariprofundus erugo]TLS67211.1 hypothetical protein FEF65_07145 [Mariprofundus erugo]
MSEGFVDLRLNNGSQDDESFWPSFTDIMMVIVLIFLLAMLTLLLKNMDLVTQLRSSLEAERTATMQARSTTDINTQLSQRLQHLEEEAAMLRMRLIDLGEENTHTLAQLQASQQANTDLKAALAALTLRHDTLMAEKSELEKNKAELAANLLQRDQELKERQQQYQLSQDQIAELKSLSTTQLDQLKKIEAEYASLEVKYNKLIRPARSSLGKYVVMVRYHKQDGQLAIEIKAENDAAFIPVDGTGLHTRLDQLQKEYGKKLYVRIVFPDDSGLSYTEAWNLTESLLRMYDYYYQE